jgi:hypothetical protein
MVAALFVESGGVYPRLLGAANCWGEERDARTYAGGCPIVAHPPCARWSRLAASVYARTRKPEHLPGQDGGCFASALIALFRCGGVVEHPASSKAFAAYGLQKPQGPGWTACAGYWVCEVWQSVYGHLASKATWLVYVGARPPFELNWARTPGTHAVSGDAKKRRAAANPPPRLSGAQNLATPEAFALELIRLATWSLP